MAGLAKNLGVPMLTFYGTGMILGAGIYSVIGKAAGITGESLWLSFFFSALVAALTALSYAELSTLFPKAGAEYIYIKEAFPKMVWVGSVIGFTMAFGGAATASTVAVAFHGYLNHFIEVPIYVVTISLLAIFTLIALWGIRESGWANIVFTIIEISGLIILIYLGLNSEKFGEALSAPIHMGTLSGAALVVFAFFGFENIVTLAEESKDPANALPKAIFLSLGISSVLYVLVSLSALALSSPESLSQSKAALMTAAASASPQMAKILGAIALFSTANTALISIVAASRLIYGMASDKALPATLAKILPKRKTPWIATLLILAFSLLLLPLGGVDSLASVASFCTMLAFLLVNISVIALRITDPKTKRKFEIPVNIKNIPVSAVLGAIFCVVFLFQFEGQIYMIGGALVLICSAAFYWYLKKR